MKLIFTLVILFASSLALAHPPSNFDNAKTHAKLIWKEIGQSSFYCNCAYRGITPEERAVNSRLGNLRIIPESCNYVPNDPLSSKGKIRAQTLRIEWEHVVPAEWIATGFGCQDQSREQCAEIPGFKKAEADLFNLVPAVGELNVDRSARLYGEINGEKRIYGSCDFEVDKTGVGEPHVRGMAEPMESIRGDIARIWFYMADRYGVVIPAENKALLDQWAIDDPIDQAEIDRHDRIAASMGWNNKFVRP